MICIYIYILFWFMIPLTTDINIYTSCSDLWSNYRYIYIYILFWFIIPLTTDIYIYIIYTSTINIHKPKISWSSWWPQVTAKSRTPPASACSGLKPKPPFSNWGSHCLTRSQFYHGIQDEHASTSHLQPVGKKNGKTLVKPCHWKTTHDWEWFFYMLTPTIKMVMTCGMVNMAKRFKPTLMLV